MVIGNFLEATQFAFDFSGLPFVNVALTSLPCQDFASGGYLEAAGCSLISFHFRHS